MTAKYSVDPENYFFFTCYKEECWDNVHSLAMFCGLYNSLSVILLIFIIALWL